MEQLEQLAAIRDAAEKRLEEARAALERSPDAKLVASLTLLIDDLKKSFEADGAAVAAETADAAPSTNKGAESAVEESPVETNSAVQDGIEAELEDVSSPAADAGAVEDNADAAPVSEEFSLEDSLEAELLNVDDGASKS